MAINNIYLKAAVIVACVALAICGKLFFNWTSTNTIEAEAESIVKQETGVDISPLIDELPTKV